MSVIFNLILLLTEVTFILSALPPIEKCPLSDSSCLQKSAQNVLTMFAAGIPEVGTEPLEPVSVDVIDVDLAGLKLTVTDVNIQGLGKSVVDKVKFDNSKKIFKLEYHANMVIKGKYKASGRLLILPISGDGDLTIKIKKIELAMIMPYEIIKNENGKDIINLKSFKYSYENRENTHFKLTNLFNGNKELSNTMHTFMNQNWQAISQEFGTPMLVKPMQKIFNAIRIYLRSQPLEDITVV